MESESRQAGIKVKAAAVGRHTIQLEKALEGKPPVTLGTWKVERTETPCSCCPPHASGYTETLELRLFDGPAHPVVLWKRISSNSYCPDVQSAMSSNSHVGWDALGKTE